MRLPGWRGRQNDMRPMVELFAADMVLSQPTGPTVSAVSGGLAEDPTVSGTSDVAFHATDPGSGVYEAIVEVDGQVIEHEVINEDGGRCRNVGGTTDGLPAFLYTQPCPAEASADLPLDTTALTNGEHHLVVSVTDAAGNAATVLDREITVANQLPPAARRAESRAHRARPKRWRSPRAGRATAANACAPATAPRTRSKGRSPARPAWRSRARRSKCASCPRTEAPRRPCWPPRAQARPATGASRCPATSPPASCASPIAGTRCRRSPRRCAR